MTVRKSIIPIVEKWTYRVHFRYCCRSPCVWCTFFSLSHSPVHPPFPMSTEPERTGPRKRERERAEECVVSRRRGTGGEGRRERCIEWKKFRFWAIFAKLPIGRFHPSRPSYQDYTFRHKCFPAANPRNFPFGTHSLYAIDPELIFCLRLFSTWGEVRRYRQRQRNTELMLPLKSIRIIPAAVENSQFPGQLIVPIGQIQNRKLDDLTV